MSTTTLRLPADLKARIDKLATGNGQTPHAFMVEALSQTAELLERQEAFDADIERRAARFERRREVITFDEFRQYAMELAAGKKPPKPKPRKLVEVLGSGGKRR